MLTVFIILYGHQEGRFYHGYYRDYCYLPVYVFCGEHLWCARLRTSDIDASADPDSVCSRLIARIEQRVERRRPPALERWEKAHRTATAQGIASGAMLEPDSFR